jgi:hypothetical protein
LIDHYLKRQPTLLLARREAATPIYAPLFCS